MKKLLSLLIVSMIGVVAWGQVEYNTGYPKVEDIAETTVTVVTNITATTYFTNFVILEASDTPPTVEEVIDWAYTGNSGTLPENTYGEIAVSGRGAANSDKTFNASNLTAGTDYVLYCVTTDDSYTAGSGIETDTPTTFSFSTLSTSPQWAPSYPNLQNQTKTGLDVYGQVDAGGDYYLVVTASSSTPSEAQIEAGQDHTGAAALITSTASISADTEFIANLDISGLSSETDYWVYIVTKDASSNYSSIQQLAFTTLDTQAPTYAAPKPEMTNITGTTATLENQINEDGRMYWVILLASEVAPSISQVLNGTDSNDNPVSSSGNRGLITDELQQVLTNSYTSETDYVTYLVTRDNNDNYIETINPTSIPFTTADVTAPVATFDPVHESVDVETSKIITISFTEEIYNSSAQLITNSNVASIVSLNENSSGGPSVSATITYDEENFIISIDPISTLKELQLYNISLDDVEDASDNTLSSSNTTFTTEDSTPPITSFDDPQDHDTNRSIGSPLTISFNEVIKKLDGTDVTNADLQTLISFNPGVTFTAVINDDEDGVTIYPDPYMTPETTYTLTFNQVEDAYGNEQISASSIEFTTAQFNTWDGSAGDNDFFNSNNYTGGYVAGASVTVPAGTPEVVINSNTSFPNLIVEPLASVTINSGVNVSLSEELTIKSDATGTGSLIIDGSISVTGSKVNVEQNISSPSRYYFISSPIQSATINTIGADGPSYYWDNTAGTWSAQGADTDFTSLNGYILKSSNDLLYQGALNNGPFSVDVKGTPKNSGFTLAGNPYTAAIDWDLIAGGDKVDIENEFWIWLTTDTYGTYNGTTGVGTNLEGDESLIPSSHGFWVKAIWSSGQTVTGSLTVRESYLAHNQTSYLKSSGHDENTIPHILLSGIHNGIEDEKLIAFSPNASESYEEYDSEKRFGTNTDIIELYTIVDSKKLTINTYPELIQNMIIPLAYKTQTSGNFKIRLKDIVNIDNNLQVLLTDHQESITVDLNTVADYEFSSEAINNTNRFSIELIGDIATDIQKTNNIELVEIYSVNETAYIKTPVVNNPKFIIYDIDGKLVKSDTLESDSINGIQLHNKGIYIVKVICEEFTTTKKIIIY